jgi:hypothetical protein
VFLDFFVLTDTVRIVLRGGLDDSHKQQIPTYQAAARSTADKPLAARPAVQSGS